MLLLMNLIILPVKTTTGYETYKLRNQLNSWRMMIIKDFDIDPLICTKCGNQMLWQYRVC